MITTPTILVVLTLIALLSALSTFMWPRGELSAIVLLCIVMLVFFLTGAK